MSGHDLAGTSPVRDSFPVYQGIPSAANNPSLIRSFSLFKLFRSSSSSASTSEPALPSTTLLRPLLSLPDAPPPSPQQVQKALSSFVTFLNQLQAFISDARTGDGEEVALKLEDAFEGYCQAFKAVSQVVWTEEEADAPNMISLPATLATSIQGVFYAFKHITEYDFMDLLSDPPKTLLASIFPPQTTHSTLTPLFERSRHLLQALRTASRPIAHSKAVSRSSPPPASAKVTEQDVLEVTSLLELFAQGYEGIERLQGPQEAKTKAQKEEDKRRPLRLAMEARVMRCDLALSLANRDIKSIRARANKAAKEIEEGKPEVEDEDDDDESKPRLNISVEDDEDTGSGLKWEDISADALIQVLTQAKELMTERRGGVLSARIEREDWLDDEEERPSATPMRSTPDTDEDQGGHVDSESEDEIESEDESEASSVEDDAAYPCPLRAIFRLHDRYEEQRLAVWLSLPTSTRAGMGTYMRGEGGGVGAAWDTLGLLLLLDFDQDSLGGFGLSGDKLDKWVDLASRGNAKKIRRKGRKSV